MSALHPDSTPSQSTSDLLAELAARQKVERELRQSIRELTQAQEQARASVSRLGELQKATAAMATALTVREVGNLLLSVCERVLSACAGVFYVGDIANQFCLQTTLGVSEVPDEWKVLPLDAPLPLATALRTGRSLWIEDHPSLVRLYPNLAVARLEATSLQAVVALPLVQGGRVLGGFALSFSAARRFDADERDWLESFASQCALAIERARLYEEEQKARSEAEVLFRIAASLNSTQLDLDVIIQRVTDEATAAVGAQAGAFLYNGTDEHGGPHLIYKVSGSSQAEFATFGLPRHSPSFAPTFAAEGVVRLDDITTDVRYGQLGAHHAILPRHLSLTSYLAVPVTARDGTAVGGLFFSHSERGWFTPQHENVIKILAVTAAGAVENANLFRATRRADEKQKRLVSELTDTVRMNELFAGVLAHDLRNPLSAIMTAGEVALSRTTDERVIKPMLRVLRSGERMLRMVEQLLDFTRIRVGNGMPIQPRPAELVALVRQVADELRAAAPEVRVEIQEVGDTRGVWDEDRLAQVFSNLLGNAREHGPRGELVSVRIDGSDVDTLHIQVHNQGTMPTNVAARLFEPFGRADRQIEKSRGLGLGLFITREIVAMHGGSVQVESTETSGTTFSVTLPRVVVAPRSSPHLVASRPGQEAKEATDQLRGSEERFRLLVETVKDYAMFMLDPVGRVQTWNPGAERIKGYAASEIVGKHVSVFYGPEEVGSGVCQRELETAAREGRFQGEGWRLRKDGSRFWASTLITALRHPKGELLGFAKITRDLTEPRKLEAEQIRLVHAQEAIRLRDEFLSIVSHELKTPLSGLQLQLENLQRRSNSSDQVTATQLKRATESGNRLASLIETLLDASRIATGQMVLAPERCDLALAVAEVVEALGRTAAKSGCPLIVRLEGALFATLDRARLQQAITNLLTNAFKYSPGAVIEVTLRRDAGEARQGDVAVVEVRDHGPGVPEQDLARIFGRFERAVSIQHHGGMGLGLYVVGEIARAHGGSVAAENVEGGGARFTLRLPLRALTWVPDATTAVRQGSH